MAFHVSLEKMLHEEVAVKRLTVLNKGKAGEPEEVRRDLVNVNQQPSEDNQRQQDLRTVHSATVERGTAARHKRGQVFGL